MKSKQPSKPRARAKTSRATPDWRDEMLNHLRALVLKADPRIIEERKWRKPSNPAGVPVFSREGILFTGESYKTYVKLTFMHGASLPDPARLFNAGFGGGTRRAIDIAEGGRIHAAAFKALVKAAVARNLAVKSTTSNTGKTPRKH